MSFRLFQLVKEVPILVTNEIVILPTSFMKINLTYASETSRDIDMIESEFWKDDNWMNKPLIILPLTAEEYDSYLSATETGRDSMLINQIGCIVNLTKLLARSHPKPHFQIFVRGLGRVQIKRVIKTKSYLKVAYNHQESKLDTTSLPQSVIKFQEKAESILKFLRTRISNRLAKQIDETLKSTPPELFPDLLASVMNARQSDKLLLLRAVNLEQRFSIFAGKILKLFQDSLTKEADKDENSIKLYTNSNENPDFSDLDKIAMRRNKSRSDSKELVKLRERLQDADMPPHARETAETELMKLEKMQPHNPEYFISSSYLEFLLDLPWSKSTKDNVDLKKARNELEADHYGMTKLKRRILEFLAVQSLKNDLKGPILCFIGPPGVGKTSIAQTIANILGRKSYRISLGGVADQSEIRGHRRTYIGSMPGRILQGIKRVGVNNPVIILDEVDKLGRGIHGDPAGALLEVLDPEQNHTFVDHYLGIHFDLSSVLFVTTANTVTTIPPALRDRLEMIHIHGYSQEEKVEIAQRYLIPKQLKRHGLDEQQVKITPASTQVVIANYTKEAGVRNLERQLAAICRYIAVKVAEKELQDSIHVLPKMLSDILGPIKFEHDVAERVSRPGVATGLAWTAFGGEIMFVEATIMKGDGKMTLTGMLGDVMKESAQLALNWIKTNSSIYHLAWEPKETDIHLHFPAGAVGKDGPSAGVTIVSAIMSILTGECVNSNLSMTGEITLRGLVLPVGGIKEKVLAAHRAGIKRVILPKKNETDLNELPQTLLDQMQFILITSIAEVIDVAFSGVVRPMSKL